jgi:hypothetical protein
MKEEDVISGDAFSVAHSKSRGCTKGVLITVPRGYKIYIRYGYSLS